MGLRLTHCRERVGGFARLADYDDQIVRVNDRVAVAIFRGELNADREPCEVLNHVLGGHADMVGGAAAYDGDAVEAANQFVAETELREIHMVVEVFPFGFAA